MPSRKRKSLVQVKLRIPEDLKRQLDREAQKRDDLSLSAEIADRLRKSFLPDEKSVLPDGTARKLAFEILKALRENGIDREEFIKHYEDGLVDRDPRVD